VCHGHVHALIPPWHHDAGGTRRRNCRRALQDARRNKVLPHPSDRDLPSPAPTKQPHHSVERPISQVDQVSLSGAAPAIAKCRACRDSSGSRSPQPASRNMGQRTLGCWGTRTSRDDPFRSAALASVAPPPGEPRVRSLATRNGVDGLRRSMPAVRRALATGVEAESRVGVR
jgi:hypothetical protein